MENEMMHFIHSWEHHRLIQNSEHFRPVIASIETNQ